MASSFLKRLFGDSSTKELKKIEPLVKAVEALEDLLPEAFAACREAAWRVLGMKPYRVQVIGGIVLHQGRIAEMKTGEGKTLVAILPAYLNALSGKGVRASSMRMESTSSTMTKLWPR